MKKISVAIVGLILLPLKLMAGDFDRSQHNFKISTGDFNFESRQEFNSLKDHFQIGYTGINHFEINYRYVDNAVVEHRARITYRGFSNDTFFFNPRLEYRYFEGNADDYYRLRVVIGAKHKISKIILWTDFQPSWNLGNSQEVNDFKIDSSQVRVGLDYFENKNLSFGPFIQYDMNRDWQKSDLFLGTNFAMKF